MIVPLEYEVPMERNAAVAIQAELLFIIAGMEPIDSNDGSQNWWVFQEEAGKIVDDIRRRFPPISDISAVPSDDDLNKAGVIYSPEASDGKA